MFYCEFRTRRDEECLAYLNIIRRFRVYLDPIKPTSLGILIMISLSKS